MTKEVATMTLDELKKSSNKKNFDQIISDLKHGFTLDFTDLEACRYAGISHDTYYRWYKESDEFAVNMEIAKDFMSKAAKTNIGDKVASGDTDLAKWWLERRRKQDYAARTETDVTTLGQSVNFAGFDTLTPQQRDEAMLKRAEELLEGIKADKEK